MRTKINNENDSDVLVINCTSRSKDPLYRQLSPFFLGPVQLYDGLVAKRHENAWQYSKVYKGHTDEKGEPTAEYHKWARQGWANPKAVRFPMGRGAKPEYALWKGEHLGYVEARKKIYAPTYAALVVQTEAYKRLQELRESGKYSTIWLRDFDGYDSEALGMTLSEVLNCEERKMGHAFVLAMCLRDERCWKWA